MGKGVVREFDREENSNRGRGFGFVCAIVL